MSLREKGRQVRRVRHGIIRARTHAQQEQTRRAMALRRADRDSGAALITTRSGDHQMCYLRKAVKILLEFLRLPAAQLIELQGAASPCGRTRRAATSSAA